MGRPRLEHRTNRRRPISVAVSDRDRAKIEERAAAAGLAVSAYLRAVGLGRATHAILDHAAVRELAKVAGDQGRLGGLLKLWLVDQPGRGVRESDVRHVLESIEALQGKLAEIAGRV